MDREVDLRTRLRDARARMTEALNILDECSLSAAAANLDMAIHQLDRELATPSSDLADSGLIEED